MYIFASAFVCGSFVYCVLIILLPIFIIPTYEDERVFNGEGVSKDAVHKTSRNEGRCGYVLTKMIPNSKY